MYNKITLDNGVRIVYEKIPYVRSVAIGLWIATGSRFEKASENGAAHFIEHMVFKGTKNRSAGEIAEIMDAIGGQINAFTTKECTCFYGRVLDTHLNTAVDVLSDMFFNSEFAEENITNERGVILEEIKMYKDTPEDLVTENLFGVVFKGTSLGRPILGTPSTLRNMDGTFLKEYMSKHYSAPGIVIAVSGNFSDTDIENIRVKFSEMPSGKPEKLKKAQYTPSFILKKKNTEQNHICIAFPGINESSENRFVMQLMSSILGGGMSSRLFQTLREDRGLCYSVYSFGSRYADIGLFGIYSAVSRETETETLRVIMDELKRFIDKGVSEDELSIAREQIKANVLMGLESTNSRMSRLARNEMIFGYVPDIDDITTEYDDVTTKDILRVAEETFDISKISFSAVGKLLDQEEYAKILME